ncbi:hypothetical protein M3210_08290 [Oceanobacillus luteolus]|uniref:Uncharacterized protein n=1 Tax=Oceanobacillus luteolus TaxID=1274358 RepID=A0ABW4HP88_9BACI|nr:hypothetical protein [Oceanobacillus luteolus]MCM3740267.1 hypothetical protein [Oceanobacillus luteolus]
MKKWMKKIHANHLVRAFVKFILILLAIGMVLLGMIGGYLLIADFLYNN